VRDLHANEWINVMDKWNGQMEWINVMDKWNGQMEWTNGME
jgi:hypothetical protein